MRSWRGHKNGLVVDWTSSAPLVRAYVTLFERLCLTVADEPHRFLVVTSATRGEGRSNVAANVASCCARLGGRKTLLIDADLERPRVASLLGVDGSKGVCDALVGRSGWQEFVCPIGDGTLSVLPAGTAAPSALVAAEPSRLAAMISEWRSQYDWVIADSPPVLQSAGAVLLGRHATGAMLVVRAGRTREEVVSQAAARLRESSVRLLAAVLNRRRFSIPGYAYRRL